MAEPEVKEAVELFDEKARFIVTHFTDGYTSVCGTIKDKPIDCYTTEDKDKKIMYMIQSWLSDLGLKVKKLE
jgi:hypothetical protein